MTDEQKIAEETAAAAAEAQAKAEKETADAEFENTIADLSDEEKEAKRSERASAHSQTDYEAIAKKEREGTKKADDEKAANRFKTSEQKRKDREARIAAGESAEDIDREERGKVLTQADLDDRLAQEREATEKRLGEAQARTIVEAMTESVAEADAVLATFNNRRFPPHLSLEEQLEEAYIIVNGKRLIGKNKELARAVKGKQGIKDNPAPAHRDQAGAVGDPSLDAQKNADLKKLGFTWNKDLKRHEKKIQGGVLVRDLKKNINHFIRS